LMGDDAIGLIAARKLAEEVPNMADVRCSSEHGMALMDLFVGYERAIIIDAVAMPGMSPGRIIELVPDDLRAIPNPSPHYTGIPEMIKAAYELRLDFPDDIRIIGIEINDACMIGSAVSKPVASALEKIIYCVKAYLLWWQMADENRNN